MWNDEKIVSIRIKKVGIYIGSIIISVLLFIISFCFIIPKDAQIETYISTIAVLLTIIGYILSITNQLVSRQMSTDMTISVNATVIYNDVIITSMVENKGLECIENISFFLFIDQPRLNETTRVYEYDHILKHKYDSQKCKYQKFCPLSKCCLKRRLQEYPVEVKGAPLDHSYYGFKRLDFLSNNSAMYINPGEQFSEDVSFNLSKGIYRVILVCRYKKDNTGCVCANKQFVIE